MSCESDDDWRSAIRRCVLCESDAPFVLENDLVWLDVARMRDDHGVDLMPLASLAECGHMNCACTRSPHNSWVRRRFREEVVRRCLDAFSREDGGAGRELCYVSFGAGLLLGDLDVICGLQAAGFTVVTAVMVDTDYRDNCHEALQEFANFMLPHKVVAFTSAAELAAAVMRGQLPGANVFVQIDSDEISVGEAIALSAVAMSDAGGDLGFRLSNHHAADGLVPMLSWRRKPTPDRPFHSELQRLRSADSGRAHGGVNDDAQLLYEQLLKRVDVAALVEVDREPVRR